MMQRILKIADQRLGRRIRPVKPKRVPMPDRAFEISFPAMPGHRPGVLTVGRFLRFSD
jgi:hypothetical protein